MSKSQGSRPFKRADGRWSAKWYDTDGQARYIYGRTRNEVKEKLAKAIDKRDRGVTTDKVTLEEWLDWWLSRNANTLRASTRLDYEYKLSLLPQWLLDKQMAEVQPVHVDKALQEIAETPTVHGNPRAASTVAAVRRVLGQALAVADRYGKVDRNAARLTDAVKADPPEIEPLTIGQAKLLLEDLWDSQLHYSLFLVMVMVGLRISEALGCRWSDIDLDTGRLSIRQTLVKGEPDEPEYVLREVTKSRTSRRDVALPATAVQALRRWKVRCDQMQADAGTAWHDLDLVWPSKVGTPLSRNAVLKLLQRRAKKVGIKKVTLHMLRHSAATIMLAAGVPERVILDVLGHATPAMMMRYQHVVDELRGEAADAVEDAFSLGDDDPEPEPDSDADEAADDPEAA